MKPYKVILIAIDKSKEAYEVAERGKSLAQDQSSSLHIVHVIEPLTFAYNTDVLLDLTNIEAELEKQAKKHLQKVAAHLAIPESQQHLILGSAAREIHELTERLSADLVVIGTHGRSGLALLLGSTANSVLHGSKCDVLAVRIGKL